MALGNVHLTPQLVQAVRDAVDVVEIASDYTKLQKAGKRYKGLCPIHKEKTPSFSVDPDQGLFYCFGCGEGGDAIKLHQVLSGDDFPAAIEALARRYGIPLPSRPARGRGGEREPDLEHVLDAAEGFFRERLAASQETRRYLEEREIPAELVERYRLGLAPPGWTTLYDALRGSVSFEELERAGLVARSRKSGKPYDRFRNRLMFPIRIASGRLVGFGGRTLENDEAKYVNTAETERFHKGSILYGLDQAKRAVRDAGSAVLVEGYFDVLGAVAAGVENAVAGMGTALTEEQARLLARFADEAVVGYDADEAGTRAFRRSLPLLLAEGLGVRRLSLASGLDPDSFRLEHGDEALRRAVAEAPDAVSFEIERLTPRDAASEPRRQAAAAQEVLEILRPIRNGVLRYGYANQAAARLQIPVELLWRKTEPGKDEPASPQRPAENLVRSLEERTLQLLMTDEEIPPADELPPAEVFFLPANRNIYEAFVVGYQAGGRPEPRAILSQLDGEGGSVDRMARLLLENTFDSRSGELGEAIGKLARRWHQQRLRDLTAEIGDAQRSGDGERLERLLREKTALSLDLHRP